jgi:RNA polymerase sigma-70 factor (ECF subfamily)
MIRRTAERRREEHDSSQVARLAADLDPELAYLKDRYATEMEQAVVHALAHLSDRERTLMRLHLGEHMTIDQLGAMYRVNRATAARWLTAARESLVARARSDLRLRLRLSESECDSIVALVRSQLDVSIVRRLS